MEEPKTAKEMLALLDTFLSDADLTESKKLWDVMTALRGPDNKSDTFKDHYTIPVRVAAFPKLAAMNGRETGSIFYTFDDQHGYRPDSKDGGYGSPLEHFVQHAHKAAFALELTKYRELESVPQTSPQ
jgi:hypothetical protein